MIRFTEHLAQNMCDILFDSKLYEKHIYIRIYIYIYGYRSGRVDPINPDDALNYHFVFLRDDLIS